MKRARVTRYSRAPAIAAPRARSVARRAPGRVPPVTLQGVPPSVFAAYEPRVYVSTTAELLAALAAASAGDGVYLTHSLYAGDLSAAIEVPSGVALIGRGHAATRIIMPNGTPTVPTVRFRGSNFTYGIGFVHQVSQDGSEGGINLCGDGHVFQNCRFDGNQDTFALGITGASTDADRWSGGTEFQDCLLPDWNFDFIRPNTLAAGGQGDIYFRNCYVRVSHALAQKFIRGSNFGYRLELTSCEIDALVSTSGGFSMLTGTDGAGYKTKTAVSGANAAMSGGQSTITQTGAFTAYVLRQGDVFRVASGGTVGTYAIAQRVSNDAIIVTGEVNESDIGDNSLVGNIEPGYQCIIRDSVINTNSICDTANSALFRLHATFNGAGVGVQVELDNVTITAPSGLRLATGPGTAHTSPSPQPQITLRDCALPAGWTFLNCNATNKPKLILRGTTLTTATWTLTDGATITADPNLGATQVCENIAGNRTLAASTVSGAYETGQEFTVVLSSDGSERTVTPDDVTVIGSALTVPAEGSVSQTYRYSGTAWAEA